ncbi:hypothetical protein AWB81_07012 [Caballeronia arationis]|nr:hypothetical protein AWB81_07012 [Caballeronia arationis]
MNNQVTVLPNEQPYLDQARTSARAVLAQSNMFKSMSLSEQQEIYSTLVEDEKRKAMKRAGVLAKSMATDSGKEMGYKGYDPSFGQDTKAFTELVDSVDFPQFVGDLLKAVFNANLRVMKEQTDSYIKLMKEATKSTADFVKNVKDDESFLKLAEAKQEQYSVTSERQADGSNKIVLATPDGDKVDPEDAAVKKDILEAKVLMAKEHRAALREVLLMGVTRLVVEKGEIEASVDFSVKAGRESKAHHDDQNINVTSLNTEYDGGGIGAIFGGPSGSLSSTNTNIQVNTSDKKATDDLSATLHGKVNIKFKTDYFKLDNFANMYGDGGVAALKPPATGSAPAAPAR